MEDLPDYLVEELDDYIRYLKKEDFNTERGGDVDLQLKTPRRRVVRFH